MNKIEIFYFISAMLISGLLTSCATPDPPRFPPNSPADPQVRSSSKLPRFAGRDETTEEIKRALSGSEEETKSAQAMQHDMHNMPGMEHGEMQHGGAHSSEKKALAEKMKKTSDEMKATSDEMKKKSDEMKTEAALYTCPMHPQVQSDQPGKCPICGVTLVKKKKGE